MEHKCTENCVRVKLSTHLDYNRRLNHTDNFHSKALIVRRGNEIIFTVEARDHPLTHWQFEIKHRLANQSTTISSDTPSQSNWKITKSKKSSTEHELKIGIPVTAEIGHYNMTVKLNAEVFSLEPPLVILFNPWHPLDTVGYHSSKVEKQTEFIEEYVSSSTGMIYFGSSESPLGIPWNYGQYTDGLLDIILSLLYQNKGFQMSHFSQPTMVVTSLAHLISKVMTVNEGGSEEDSISSFTWRSAADIFQLYNVDNRPVRFGSCFCLGALLTCACRALGVPCRPVTVFNANHDKCKFHKPSNNFTINIDLDQPELSEKWWLFHIWNECWMARPDLTLSSLRYSEEDWQLVDSSPSTKSSNIRGPVPRKAILEGFVDLSFYPS